MFEAGIVIAIIMAAGQFAKMYIPGKYVPIVTLILGVAGGYFYLPHVTVQEAVMNGAMVALAATVFSILLRFSIKKEKRNNRGGSLEKPASLFPYLRKEIDNV